MKKISPHIRLGQYGEKIAGEFLSRKGYEILGRNIHFQNAQVDLAARDGAWFVLVEVKTMRWRPDRETIPARNFSPAQQKRLRRAAGEMMRKFKNVDFPVRCDLVEILTGRYFPRLIRHHVNFFEFRSRKK